MNKIVLPRILQPFRCDDIIRLGKDNDGGYLVNRLDVIKSEKLLSFGIADDWSFEQDFTNLNDCVMHSYDEKCDGEDKFFSGKRKHFLQNITKDNLPIDGQNIFLKCDIEGAEYEIMDQLIANSKKFTGMSLEFHNIHQPHQFNELTNFISKIDLKLIHIHVNNWFYYIVENDEKVICNVELSFTSSNNIRLDRNLTLPHYLDMPNNPNNEQFQINF